jgi:glycosyltransferase involved in cell wall biosynthesis
MSRLSLCMIVRDEARFLAACLESALPAVDEAIVVDTGSSDATPRIAAEAGARVLSCAWQEDFAAARNAALDAATGTHVLVLDADERLVPEGHAALRAALENRDLALGLLPLFDADALDAPARDVVSGARRLWEPVRLPRLFRRHPALRFRRRVHETLLSDPQATLDAVGGKILPVEAPIVHYGEVRSLRQDLDKAARNRRHSQRSVRGSLRTSKHKSFCS